MAGEFPGIPPLFQDAGADRDEILGYQRQQARKKVAVAIGKTLLGGAVGAITSVAKKARVETVELDASDNIVMPAAKKQKTVKQIATTAVKNATVKAIRNIARKESELKFVDTVITAGTSITSAPTTGTWLLSIPQGAGAVQRIGRNIRVERISMRIQLNSVNAAVLGDSIRLMIIKDTDANRENLATSNIFTSTVTPYFQVAHVQQDSANARRYQLLYDRVVNIEPHAGWDATPENYPAYAYVKKVLKKKFVVNFNNVGTGGYGDCDKNGLWFVVTSAAHGVGTTYASFICAEFRVYFRDL